MAAPAAAQPAPPGPWPFGPVVADAVTTLARAAARAVAPAGARIEVELGAPDRRLTLAPCARIEPHLAHGVPALGRTRVALRCADGSARWNIALPVTVRAWAPAWTAAAPLPAGARLSTDQLVLADTDWGAAAQPPSADARLLEGRTLARPVAAGQALRAPDLQPRRWFVAGDTVQVVARGSGFSVRAEGQALAPGLDGQRVRVRLDRGGEGGPPVVVGRAVGERRVELDL